MRLSDRRGFDAVDRGRHSKRKDITYLRIAIHDSHIVKLDMWSVCVCCTRLPISPFETYSIYHLTVRYRGRPHLYRYSPTQP